MGLWKNDATLVADIELGISAKLMQISDARVLKKVENRRIGNMSTIIYINDPH
jgi:hypothetical protein